MRLRPITVGSWRTRCAHPIGLAVGDRRTASDTPASARRPEQPHRGRPRIPPAADCEPSVGVTGGLHRREKGPGRIVDSSRGESASTTVAALERVGAHAR